MAYISAAWWISGGLDTRDVLYGFGSVVLDGLPPFVKAVRVFGDEFLVVEAIVDQAVGKGVEERDVATVLDRKVEIGDTRGFDMARVGDDDLATLFFGSHDTPCDDGVRIGRVIAEEENAARHPPYRGWSMTCNLNQPCPSDRGQ